MHTAQNHSGYRRCAKRTNPSRRLSHLESLLMHLGLYRHYKGQLYTVIGVARHSETQEELVVYRQEYGDCALWVRPRHMFEEVVTVEGKTMPRFAPLQDQPHMI